MAHPSGAGDAGPQRDRRTARRSESGPSGGLAAWLTRLVMWPRLRSADRLRDQRNWTAASKEYERVLAVAKQADDIRVQLGHVYKEAGRLDDAANQYYNVLSRKPDDDDLHLQVGHLEKLRLNWRKASYHYGEAVRLNPDNAGAAAEYRALGGRATIGAAAGAGAVTAASAIFSPGSDRPGLPPLSDEVREILRAIAPHTAPAL